MSLPMDSSGGPPSALRGTRFCARFSEFQCSFDSCCMQLLPTGTNFSISAVVHVRIFWGSPKPAENLRQPDWEFGRLRCRKLTCRSQPCTLSLCTFSLFLYMKLALFWHGPVLDFLRTPEGCPLCGGLFCPLFLYILFLFSPIGNMSTCGVFSKALSFETVLAQPQRVEVFSRIWQ